MTKSKKEIINVFKKDFPKIFKKRLHGIYGYGSFFTKEKKSNDIDLIIILERNSPKDLIFLKKVLERSKVGNEINIQFLYKNLLIDSGNFYSINTCGSFFLEILRNELITIYGLEFPKIQSPGSIFILTSLHQKIGQYLYQAKSIYINKKICKLDEEILSKRVKFIIQDMKKIVPSVKLKDVKIKNDFKFLDYIKALEKINEKYSLYLKKIYE